MKKGKTNLMHFLAYTIVASALAASIAGNVYLFKKAKEFYAREAQVRINPVSDFYAEKNEQLKSKPKTKPRLIIFGESRCSMWAPFHPDNWGNVEIVNRGIGGETTPQILRRMEADVLELNPDLVILQMGDNDLKTMAVLPGTRRSTIDQTYSNITSMAKTLSDEGIEVVITTIFPPGPIEFFRKPLWSDEVNESIDLVNSMIMAFEYPRVTPVDCDPILRGDKHIKPEYSLDTLHLTRAGYLALNKGLEPTILPLVKGLNQSIDQVN